MSEPVLTPPAKRRWTFWRVVVLLFSYVWVAVILTAVGAGLVGFMIYDQVIQPGKPGLPVSVTIPEGASGREIGRILVESRLIEREGFFRLAVKLDGTNQIIRHGVYKLPRGLSALQYLRLLYEGPDHGINANQFTVTVPEGLSIAQAAALFENPQAFIEAAKNPELIARLGINTESLEGFLMPNTYFFDAKPAESDVVERMVAQFEKEYAQLLAQIPGSDRFDKLEVVAVASLIEEEAKIDEERAKIAAVLWNRLNKGMYLQMDSTLQYALGKYGQRILNEDKEVDSPYNTYLHPGLPPGPISSPGVASLRAALQPANVDYLYFVSNADGTTHTFSRTESEHQRAVATFRREIAPQRRELRRESTDAPSTNR